MFENMDAPAGHHLAPYRRNFLKGYVVDFKLTKYFLPVATILRIRVSPFSFVPICWALKVNTVSQATLINIFQFVVAMALQLISDIVDNCHGNDSRECQTGHLPRIVA